MEVSPICTQLFLYGLPQAGNRPAYLKPFITVYV